MREIEGYVDRVLAIARLASRDERRVRAELDDHLREIAETREMKNLTLEEISMKLEKEFGDPEELGQAIARAKGKFRTYLKKEARKAPITIAVALVLGFGLRAVAVESFRARGDELPAGIESGTWMMVNKLHREYQPNDIVVCEVDETVKVYVVREAGLADERIVLEKGGRVLTVSNDDIRGRVFLQTR